MKATLWLMDRFGVMDALTGDLVEQRRAGRSAAWLWRQTIVAVLHTTGRRILDQKGVAVLTALVSAAALLFWVESSWALYVWLSDRWMNSWVNPGGTWVNGARVGGFCRRALFTWWQLYGGGLSLVWCVGSALIGRLVARARSMPFVLVALAAQLPLILWWGVPLWFRAVAYVGLRSVHAANVRMVAAVVLIGMPFSALVAALCTAPSSRGQTL